MAAPHPTRCLILACGNPLRGDDGVGPRLAAWAADRFRDEPRVRIIASQQWTPELAEEIAGSESVIFIDSSVELRPGEIQLDAVKPGVAVEGLATHQLDAGQLLALCRDLYSCTPCRALLLTIGAQTLDYGETFSAAVNAALPKACELLERLVAIPADFSGSSIRPGL